MQIRWMAALLLTTGASAQTTLYRYTDATAPGVGAAVRSLGDLNGDGQIEIAVGSYTIFCGFGGCLPAPSRIAVLSGSGGSLLYTIDPALADGASAAIDTLADIDGDGVREILVGAPYTGGQFAPAGALRIHSGATGVELRVIGGPAPHEYFGTSVAGLGALDGDGVADVAGATWHDIRVHSGATGQELFVLPSPAVSPAQCVVARYGDFNLDGRDDLLVGFADFDPQTSGVVRVVSGLNGAVLQTFTAPVLDPTFGWAVRAVGDVDGDGKSDVLVGSPQLDVGSGPGPGFAALYSANGTLLRQIVSAQSGGQFGLALAGGADVTGDGLPDVAIASSCDWYNVNCSRSAEVFDGASGSPIATLTSTFDGFGGVSLDFVGDLDGDGQSELAFGSACTQAFETCGEARVVSLPHAGPASYCTAGVSGAGCTPTMSAAGIPSTSASAGFVLTATDIDGQRQALLFYGVTGRDALPWGASSSYLCVKSPFQRLGLSTTGGTNGQCDGSLAVDWLAFLQSNPAALGAPFVPGQTVDVQCWYRDPPSPKSTSLSNAIEFVTAP